MIDLGPTLTVYRIDRRATLHEKQPKGHWEEWSIQIEPPYSAEWRRSWPHPDKAPPPNRGKRVSYGWEPDNALKTARRRLVDHINKNPKLFILVLQLLSLSTENQTAEALPRY